MAQNSKGEKRKLLDLLPDRPEFFRLPCKEDAVVWDSQGSVQFSSTEKLDRKGTGTGKTHPF